jgi:hypothetical protein
MTFRPCSRQPEIQELLVNGHWPHACPPELRAHLADCRSCSELLMVTQAFQQSRTTAAAQVKLPPPGAIWWRAQLRRRNAAVERVGKPILGAYVFALSMTILVALAFVISQARHGLRWLDWIDWLGQSGSATLHVDSLSPSTWLSSSGALMVLIPIFAMLALLGAVAVYLAAEKQ